MLRLTLFILLSEPLYCGCRSNLTLSLTPSPCFLGLLSLGCLGPRHKQRLLTVWMWPHYWVVSVTQRSLQFTCANLCRSVSQWVGQLSNRCIHTNREIGAGTLWRAIEGQTATSSLKFCKRIPAPTLPEGFGWNPLWASTLFYFLIKIEDFG